MQSPFRRGNPPNHADAGRGSPSSMGTSASRPGHPVSAALRPPTWPGTGGTVRTARPRHAGRVRVRPTGRGGGRAEPGPPPHAGGVARCGPGHPGRFRHRSHGPTGDRRSAARGRRHRRSRSAPRCRADAAMRGRVSATLWAVGWPVRIALLSLIRAYRLTLGQMVGGRCRFYPSCSEYAEQAVARTGAVRGSILAAWRVVRCSPLSIGGVDHPPSGRLWMEPAASTAGLRAADGAGRGRGAHAGVTA